MLNIHWAVSLLASEDDLMVGLLRSPTLDHAGLEFPGFVTMAGWVCHATKAM
jgi:hypothetical protein